MRLDYPNATGTLLAPLSKTARTVLFNAELETVLSTLVEGRWTYLLIRNESNEVEVIKLAVELGQRVVYRGQDYTVPNTFGIGSTVEFVFTSEHANRIVPNLQVYRSGAIEIQDSTISYTQVDVEDTGAAQTVVSGGRIILGRNTQAYGCCGEGGDGAIAIEEPYIYLTSGFYPWYASDQFYSAGQQIHAIHVFFDHFHSVTDKVQSGGINISALDMYGGAHAESLLDKFQGSFAFTEIESYGGYHSYDNTGAPNGGDDKLEGFMLITSVEMFNDTIFYTQFPDKLDGSLVILEVQLY